MKLGLIGLPQSGKSTIFSAIAGARGEEKASRSDQLITTVKVPDERVEFLTKVFKPKKSPLPISTFAFSAPSAAGAKAEMPSHSGSDL
jgi:ribosome-binding ATPase YchF (GTP1/OBG family)